MRTGKTKLVKRRTILVTGPSLIKRVDTETALKLHEQGIESVFFSLRGVIGLEGSLFRDERAPVGFLSRAWRFLNLLRTICPDHVEMYIDRPYAILPFYALMTRLLGYPLVVWCRGELYYWDSKHTAYHRLVIRFCFRCANYLLVKEAYMPDKVLALKLARPEQIVWLPNKIPVRADYTLARSDPMVLFLNSPKRWRHIELLAEAIPMVVARVPEARFWFVGSRTEQELEYVRSEMRRTGAEPWVEIRPYESEVQVYYEQAALFVLPADLVYVNHSLLEAMERGVPPLAANVDPQVHKIVEHNVNGLVLPLDPQVWANAIVDLLRDEPRRRALGAMAREKVERDFNLEHKIDDLVHFYEQQVWRSQMKRTQERNRE